MKSREFIFRFAVVYSICMSIARYVISGYASIPGLVDTSVFFLLSFINEFAVGLIIGFLLGVQRTLGFKLITGLLILLLLALQVAIFHYEAEFGRLPVFDLIYYLTEVEHLRVSLQSTLPLSLFLLEIVLLVSALYGGLRLLSRVPMNASPRVLVTISIAMLSISVFLQAGSSILPVSSLWQSRQPLVWFVQSASISKEYNLGNINLSEKDFAFFKQVHGQTSTLPAINDEYPLCRFVPKTNAPSKYTNAILLVLEGVGQEEMYLQYKGRDVMPNLKHIAGSNISFENGRAPSEKSVTAITALFSGLPGNPFIKYLWRLPISTLNGFPNYLKDTGKTTGYFHGGDLSFERQRIYLQKVGFDHIYEYDPKIQQPVYGWGFADGFVLQQMMNWLDKRIAGNEEFFAAMYSLSTHHPYDIPEDWAGKIQDEYTRAELEDDCCGDLDDERDKITRSYRYLDEQIGLFYKWFQQNTDSTILIITGDHSPHASIKNRSTQPAGLRFDIPIIVAGLDSADRENYRNYSRRLAGLLDMPATIMSLLDESYVDCGLGLDLFQSESSWPRQRLLYAFGGDAMEMMHIWFNDMEVILDRVNEQFEIVNPGTTEFNSPEKIYGFSNQLVNAIDPVHYYLLHTDAYFPEVEFFSRPAIQQDPGNIIFASHRGNTSGPSSLFTENSREALDAVVASGFDWVELDVQLAWNGVPIVIHDPFIIIDGARYDFINMTVDEIRGLPGLGHIMTLEQALSLYADRINLLIEIKVDNDIFKISHAVNNITNLINRYHGDKQIIIDSFSDVVAASVKKQCTCQVGFDTPFREPLSREKLKLFSELGFDWIYVHHDVVNRELIEQSHAFGLRVMAYTVNDANILAAWKAGGYMADGVITDFESIRPSGK